MIADGFEEESDSFEALEGGGNGCHHMRRKGLSLLFGWGVTGERGGRGKGLVPEDIFIIVFIITSTVTVVIAILLPTGALVRGNWRIRRGVSFIVAI